MSKFNPDEVKDEEKSLVDFAFAHDTTRVLQSCLQHGTKEQRRAIFEELKPRVPEMAKEKYAKNIIWKLIKYGDREMKDYCIENLGNVRNLVRSNIGQSVLEYAYNQFAQSAQRNKMIRMLYGKSFQRLSKMDKDMSVLDCCIKNANFVDSILTGNVLHFILIPITRVCTIFDFAIVFRRTPNLGPPTIKFRKIMRVV